MPRESFAQNAKCPRINFIGCAAIFDTTDRIFQPARITELTNKFLARCINVFFMYVTFYGDICGRPLLRFYGQRSMTIFEERPFEMIRYGQRQAQFPSNSGFSFLAKA